MKKGSNAPPPTSTRPDAPPPTPLREKYEVMFAHANRLEGLIDRVEYLENALRFYANEDNYSASGSNPYVADMAPIYYDEGRRARKALYG